MARAAGSIASCAGLVTACAAPRPATTAPLPVKPVARIENVAPTPTPPPSPSKVAPALLGRSVFGYLGRRGIFG
ncbi:MAG TPA: hypothetical protein VEQ59_20620, partial [Polyangiaceae bacterium]|nr:hypothetical protein [Polyangiaceae bacterium]